MEIKKLIIERLKKGELVKSAEIERLCGLTNPAVRSLFKDIERELSRERILLVSTLKGYKIAKDERDAEEGVIFLRKKLKALGKRYIERKKTYERIFSTQLELL